MYAPLEGVRTAGGPEEAWNAAPARTRAATTIARIRRVRIFCLGEGFVAG
jgi:hypothetical protein